MSSEDNSFFTNKMSVKRYSSLNTYWNNPPQVNFRTINAPLGTMNKELSSIHFPKRIEAPEELLNPCRPEKIDDILSSPRPKSVNEKRRASVIINTRNSTTSRPSKTVQFQDSVRKISPARRKPTAKSRPQSPKSSSSRTKRNGSKIAIKPRTSLPTHSAVPTVMTQVTKKRNSTKQTDVLSPANTGQADIAEKMKYYRDLVEKAIDAKKVFMIYGNFPVIKNALRSRGWVEKLNPSHTSDSLRYPMNYLLKHAAYGNDFETVSMSNMVGQAPANFIYNALNNTSLHYTCPIETKFHRDPCCDYTSKDGFSNCANNRHWFHIINLSELRVPRSYCLTEEDEISDFVADFLFTACTSLITFIVNHPCLDYLFNEFGEVSMKCIDFAVCRIREQIEIKHHIDIDMKIYNPHKVREQDWRIFLKAFHAIVHCNKSFGVTKEFKRTGIMETLGILRKAAKTYWPDIDTDGCNNIWILKPTNTGQGHGITMWSSASHIIDFAKRKNIFRYVVQKYIEQPLLVYNTKFDIRIYLLLAVKPSGHQVDVWLYKNCYLRFSSQQYDLTNFDEAVHLTNYSVQKKYSINTKRDKRLPSNNMWLLDEWKEYLEASGNPTVWDDKIYPAIKKNVIATILCARDDTEFIRGGFELSGCDFMIDENFEPIFIEVNAYPDLSASTEVTQLICAQVQEDLIKVIVDNSKDPKADTGYFENVYHFSIKSKRIPKRNELQIVGVPSTIIGSEVPTQSSSDTNQVGEVSDLSLKRPLPKVEELPPQPIIKRPDPEISINEKLYINFLRRYRDLLKKWANSRSRPNMAKLRAKHAAVQHVNRVQSSTMKLNRLSGTHVLNFTIPKTTTSIGMRRTRPRVLSMNVT